MYRKPNSYFEKESTAENKKNSFCQVDRVRLGVGGGGFAVSHAQLHTLSPPCMIYRCLDVSAL